MLLRDLSTTNATMIQQRILDQHMNNPNFAKKKSESKLKDMSDTLSRSLASPAN